MPAGRFQKQQQGGGSKAGLIGLVGLLGLGGAAFIFRDKLFGGGAPPNGDGNGDGNGNGNGPPPPPGAEKFSAVGVPEIS